MYKDEDKSGKEKFHIIRMLVEDEPGVLAKISGMFSARAFNIETIIVGRTHKPGVSQMVISLHGDNKTLEQVEKQLNKLVPVIKVTELGRDMAVVRELCLVKVSAKSDKDRAEIMSYSKVYRNSIVDIDHNSVIVQMTGSPRKVESFLELIKKFGIKDLSRSGINAMPRSTKGKEEF